MNDALTRLVEAAVQQGSVDEVWLEEAREALKLPAYVDVFSPQAGAYLIYLDGKLVDMAQLAVAGNPGVVLLYARYMGLTLSLFRGKVEIRKREDCDQQDVRNLFDPVERILSERDLPDSERAYLGNYPFAPPDDSDTLDERQNFVEGVKDLLKQNGTEDAKELLARADEVFAELLKDDQSV